MLRDLWRVGAYSSGCFHQLLHTRLGGIEAGLKNRVFALCKTSNLRCSPKSCRAEEFESVAPSPTSNRVCNAATQCDNGAEVVALSGTSDRVCGFPKWKSGEIEVQAPTETSDCLCRRQQSLQGPLKNPPTATLAGFTDVSGSLEFFESDVIALDLDLLTISDGFLLRASTKRQRVEAKHPIAVNGLLKISSNTVLTFVSLPKLVVIGKTMLITHNLSLNSVLLPLVSRIMGPEVAFRNNGLLAVVPQTVYQYIAASRSHLVCMLSQGHGSCIKTSYS
jgi:hypothetical protein